MKKKPFMVPGIYHDIAVRVVSQKYVAQRAKDKNTIACYESATQRIYVARELDLQVKLHAFYHELSHHVVDTLEAIPDEENRCDLLGKYLMDLAAARERIEKHLLRKPDEK